MPHIHTASGQHDHTVSACIVRTDTTEPQALLHMHRKMQKLLYIGGHIELDETPWQAITHELTEESGYDISQLAVLQPAERMKQMDGAIVHPYPVCINTHPIGDDHYHTDINYAFVTDQNPQSSIATGESTDIRWLTQAELHKLDVSSVASGVIDVYDFIFDVCLEQWERVSTEFFQ